MILIGIIMLVLIVGIIAIVLYTMNPYYENKKLITKSLRKQFKTKL